MKPDQKSFEIRGEVDQAQVLAAIDRLRIASGNTVLRQSVGIKKHQSPLVMPLGMGAPPATVNGKLDDGAGVSATGDVSIEVNVEILFVT